MHKEGEEQQLTASNKIVQGQSLSAHGHAKGGRTEEGAQSSTLAQHEENF